MAARPLGAAGGAGGAGRPPPRSPPPQRSSPVAVRAARPPGAAPRGGRRAPAGRAREPGRRRAGRAPTWPARHRPPLAPPQRAKLGAGAGGGGSRRLPGVAEPLRSPRHPFPVCLTRRVPRATNRDAAVGGDAGLSWGWVRALSRYLTVWASVPPNGVATAPVCEGTVPKHRLRLGPTLRQTQRAQCGPLGGGTGSGMGEGRRREMVNLKKQTPSFFLGSLLLNLS
jgi:hypothetical protein